MNYLKYIEHDAENLQFFLWARAYREKFDKLPDSERRLSPEWTQAHADSDGNQTAAKPFKVSADTAAALKGTGLDTAPRVTEVPATFDSAEKVNPFYTPPRTPAGSDHHGTPSELSSNGHSGWTSTTESTNKHVRRKADGAYDDAGLKWQPCKCYQV